MKLLAIQVPYYHRQIDPAYFKGWRGFVVLLLNFFRFWLHRWTERSVMLYILRRQGLDAPDTLTAFKMRWAEENDEQRTKRKSLGLLGRFSDVDDDAEAGQKRYQSGRKGSMTAAEAAEQAAKNRKGSWANYLPGRANMYKQPRAESLVMEDDYTVVPKSELFTGQE